MFTVESIPKDENKLKELGKEIVIAASKLGLNFQTEGFLLSWASGTRVILERNNGEITSLLLMTVGERWVDSSVKATVLEYAGNVKSILEFAESIAKGAGATSMYYEESKPLEETEDYSRYIVREEMF